MRIRSQALPDEILIKKKNKKNNNNNKKYIYILTDVQPALQCNFVLNLQIICWLDLPRSGASTLFSWVHKKLSTEYFSYRAFSRFLHAFFQGGRWGLRLSETGRFLEI